VAKQQQRRFEEPMPSDPEAAARWKEFMERLDTLDRNISELLELGQLILLALQDAAQAGVPGGTLLSLIGKVIEKAREAQTFYDRERNGR